MAKVGLATDDGTHLSTERISVLRFCVVAALVGAALGLCTDGPLDQTVPNWAWQPERLVVAKEPGS